MPAIEYRTWMPDDCGMEDAHTTFASCPEEAAREHAEAMHSRCDYPMEMEVAVMSPLGERTDWIVTVEEVAVFHAAEKKAKAKK